jgi:hypothetical protein
MRPVSENLLIGLFFAGQGEFKERDEQFHQEIALFDIRFLLEKIADVIPDADAFQNRVGERGPDQPQAPVRQLEDFDESLRQESRLRLHLQFEVQELEEDAVKFSGALPELQVKPIPFARQFHDAGQPPFFDGAVILFVGSQVPDDLERRRDTVQLVQNGSAASFAGELRVDGLALEHQQESLQLVVEHVGLETVVDQ